MFTGLLDRSMDVMRKTVTPDSFGGHVESQTRIYSGIPCRVNVLTYDTQANLQQMGIRASHRFFCTANVDIRNGDILLVDQRQYPVVSVKNWDERDHHLTILTEDFR